jgi:hypothetical protein
MTPKQGDIRWINAADRGSGQQQGTTPAAAVVASVIAIVAARMAASINFLINITSFAAPTAPAFGHRRAEGSLEVDEGIGDSRTRRTTRLDHPPGPRADLEAGDQG